MLHQQNSPSVAPRHHRAGAVLLLVATLTAASSFQGCGGGGSNNNAEALQALLNWNSVALDTTGADHALTPPDQIGPCRTSRAMAIVHVAMFEVLIANNGGGFQSILNLQFPSGPTSSQAAIAQAAHDTLVSLFPSQQMTLDTALADELALVTDIPRRNNGIALGQAAASAILALRFNDGSQVPEPLINVDYIPGNAPGIWRQDPISLNPLALGAHWHQCLPFVISSASQFRAPVPPDLTSAAYTAAYNQVQAIGGDGIVTPSTRTPDQSIAAIYWAYDASPSLCAPPRVYNQIAVLLGLQQNLSAIELARLLAIANVALADAALACWESKYFYAYWRPVAGIRESDPGTGPSMLGDGNAATMGDVNWTPLGAPASNPLTVPGINFTPPFPAYPSGHAVFGGAAFQVFRRFFGTDSIPFTFVSDEFNGVTLDNLGNPRPLLPRSFSTFTQAEDENGQSRIYLGIHWIFDKTEGIAQGNSVGDWTFDHIYQPIP